MPREPLYRMRDPILGDIHNGQRIGKKSARIEFGVKKANLLFQCSEDATISIPSDFINLLIATPPKQSLPLINKIRDQNHMPPATAPKPVPRNLNTHEWVSRLEQQCYRARCDSLPLHYCPNCQISTCGKHKRKTGCEV